MTIRDAWDNFLQRKTLLIANGYLGYVLGAFSFHFPPFGQAVAAILFIDAVSLFDASTEARLGRAKFKKLGDLNNRIGELAQSGRLLDLNGCHQLRRRRNELGHQAVGLVDAAELDVAIALIHRQLEHWGIVGPMPPYTFDAGRGQLLDSDQPGYKAREYHTGVKLDDRWVQRLSWTQHFGPPAGPPLP